MSKPIVLILGANGRLGSAATAAFAQAGWQVRAQMRRAPTQPLPAGAVAIATPLSDTERLVAQAAGARVVVHAVNPLYTQWDTDLLPLARQGMDIAQALNARFMLPGNVYNFGEDMPAVLHADAPQLSTTLKGRQRLQIEAELAQRAAAGSLRSTVIRAGDFFGSGSGSGSWFDQAIVKDLAKGKLVYPGPLDVPHAWAYLPDLARAFVAVAARSSWGEAPAFENLHFAGHTLTGQALLDGIEQAAEALGLRPEQGFKRGGMPWAVIRAVGLVYPLWRELARMSYLWRVPHGLDGSALAQAVGDLPSTPLAGALRSSLIDLGLTTPLSFMMRGIAPNHGTHPQ